MDVKKLIYDLTFLVKLSLFERIYLEGLISITVQLESLWKSTWHTRLSFYVGDIRSLNMIGKSFDDRKIQDRYLVR